MLEIDVLMSSVRPVADGYPEAGNPLAATLKGALELGFWLREPQLLFGLLVLLCTIPALVASAGFPIALALQLLLLLASRSEPARSTLSSLLAPWPQLLACVCLGVGLLYVHAAFSYYFFGETLGGLPCAPPAGYSDGGTQDEGGDGGDGGGETGGEGGADGGSWFRQQSAQSQPSCELIWSHVSRP